MTVFFDGLLKGMNNILIGRIGSDIGKIFSQGFAGHCQTITMQQSPLQQTFHQWLNAADGNQLRHHIFAAGTQVSQYRDLAADAGKII